jgi:hypothetical protein
MADLNRCPDKNLHKDHYWVEPDGDGFVFTHYCFGVSEEKEKLMKTTEKIGVLKDLENHRISVEAARRLLGIPEARPVKKEAHVTIIINDGETSTTYIVPRMDDVEFEVEMDDSLVTNYPFPIRAVSTQAVKKITLSGKPHASKDGSYYTGITREK